jgi:hypothetical protein
MVVQAFSPYAHWYTPLICKPAGQTMEAPSFLYLRAEHIVTSFNSLTSKPFEDTTVAMGHGMVLLMPTDELQGFLGDLDGVKTEVMAVVASLLRVSHQKQALVDAEEMQAAAPKLPVAKRARKSTT